jgi:peroxiredoxin
MLLDTPICDFGWQAPDFTLKDPDGNSFTMSKNLADKGLLIMFICNHCPYVQAIASRLAGDTQALMNEGINVAAVMSNDYRYVQADSPANMKRFATQHGFIFHTLLMKVKLWVVPMERSVRPTFMALTKTVNCSTGDAWMTP